MHYKSLAPCVAWAAAHFDHSWFLYFYHLIYTFICWVVYALSNANATRLALGATLQLNSIKGIRNEKKRMSGWWMLTSVCFFFFLQRRFPFLTLFDWRGDRKYFNWGKREEFATPIFVISDWMPNGFLIHFSLRIQLHQILFVVFGAIRSDPSTWQKRSNANVGHFHSNTNQPNIVNWRIPSTRLGRSGAHTTQHNPNEPTVLFNSIPPPNRIKKTNSSSTIKRNLQPATPPHRHTNQYLSLFIRTYRRCMRGTSSHTACLVCPAQRTSAHHRARHTAIYLNSTDTENVFFQPQSVSFSPFMSEHTRTVSHYYYLV